MINLSQDGMRCRAMKEIITHEGLIRRLTEETIQGVIYNLGRQLIKVGMLALPRKSFSMRLKSYPASNQRLA